MSFATIAQRAATSVFARLRDDIDASFVPLVGDALTVQAILDINNDFDGGATLAAGDEYIISLLTSELSSHGPPKRGDRVVVNSTAYEIVGRSDDIQANDAYEYRVVCRRAPTAGGQLLGQDGNPILGQDGNPILAQ